MRNLRDAVRTVRFRPYLKGCGPTFTLHLGWTWRRDSVGRDYLQYELRQHENGITTVLFEGDDFSPLPLDDPFSDEAVLSLVGFLAACPGDVDPDYFKDYTTAQLEFCEEYASDLYREAMRRFSNEPRRPA
jgi:hypothetical protein